MSSSPGGRPRAVRALRKDFSRQGHAQAARVGDARARSFEKGDADLVAFGRISSRTRSAQAQQLALLSTPITADLLHL